MIDDTPPHKALMARESKPSVIKAEPLSIITRKVYFYSWCGRGGVYPHPVPTGVVPPSGQWGCTPIWLAGDVPLEYSPPPHGNWMGLLLSGLNGGNPPSPACQESEQQSEHLLCGGRYASCVHTGGLSSWVIVFGWFKRSLKQSIGSFSCNPHFALFQPDRRWDIFRNASDHWGMVTYNFFRNFFFRSLIRASTGSFANVCQALCPISIKLGQILCCQKIGHRP